MGAHKDHSGVGLATQKLPQGPRLTVLAVVNALGRRPCGGRLGPRGPPGGQLTFARTATILREQAIEPRHTAVRRQFENTTLLCVDHRRGAHADSAAGSSRR